MNVSGSKSMMVSKGDQDVSSNFISYGQINGEFITLTCLVKITYGEYSIVFLYLGYYQTVFVDPFIRGLSVPNGLAHDEQRESISDSDSRLCLDWERKTILRGTTQL